MTTQWFSKLCHIKLRRSWYELWPSDTLYLIHNCTIEKKKNSKFRIIYCARVISILVNQALQSACLFSAKKFKMPRLTVELIVSVKLDLQLEMAVTVFIVIICVNKDTFYLYILQWQSVCMQFHDWLSSSHIDLYLSESSYTVSGSSQAWQTGYHHLLCGIRKAIFLTDEGCVLAKEQECTRFNETSHGVQGLRTALGCGGCVDCSDAVRLNVMLGVVLQACF